MKKMLLRTLALVSLIAVVATAPASAEGKHKMGHGHTGDHRHMKSTATIPLAIEGMTCVKCEKKIKKALDGLDGIKTASVSFKDSEAVIEYDPQKVSKGRIMEAIKKAGYKATTKE